MTTDRELLELAARAAGLNADTDYGGYDDLKLWNPLVDDKEAFRLAVKLGLAIHVLEKCVFVESAPETLLGFSSVSELEMYGNSDPYTAARRAIVRAAAEIGRNM